MRHLTFVPFLGLTDITFAKKTGNLKVESPETRGEVGGATHRILETEGSKVKLTILNCLGITATNLHYQISVGLLYPWEDRLGPVCVF